MRTCEWPIISSFLGSLSGESSNLYASSSMASLTPVSQSKSLLCNTALKKSPPPRMLSSLPSPNFMFSYGPKLRLVAASRISRMPMRAFVVTATTAEKPRKKYPGEAKGFVEEMRFVAMKLHTREQAKEGEKQAKQPEEKPVAKWEPTVEGYLRFLVDSKLVYDTLENIVEKASVPYCESTCCLWISLPFVDYVRGNMDVFIIWSLRSSVVIRPCDWGRSFTASLIVLLCYSRHLITELADYGDT